MINKVEFEGFKYIGGGVCAAQGFKANGIQCGLAHKPLTDTEKNTAESNNALPSAKKKNDLAVIIADKECTAAAVYTTNKVKGAPIQVTKSNIADGKARGVIVNSVNANTCNADGVEKAEKMCELVSDQFGLKPSDFIVASTGVIGQVLPIEPIEKGMPELCKGVSYEGNSAAVEAIMTTDTMPKEVAVEFEINGKKCVMGGMLNRSFKGKSFFRTVLLIPWAILMLILGKWERAIWLFVIYVICYFLREILEAKLMSRKVGMTPFETLLSMYVGVQLFGIFGFLLGPAGFLLIRDLNQVWGHEAPDNC